MWSLQISLKSLHWLWGSCVVAQLVWFPQYKCDQLRNTLKNIWVNPTGTKPLKLFPPGRMDERNQLTMTIIVGRVEIFTSRALFITHSHVVKYASVTNTHQLQTLNCNRATVGNISGYRPRGLVLWSNLAINQYCFWLPTKLEIVIFSEAWDRKRQNSVFY